MDIFKYLLYLKIFWYISIILFVSPVLSSFYIAISFDPYKVGAIITSYHGWRNWGLSRLYDLSKVTQVAHGGPGQSSSVGCQTPLLTTSLIFPLVSSVCRLNVPVTHRCPDPSLTQTLWVRLWGWAGKSVLNQSPRWLIPEKPETWQWLYLLPLLLSNGNAFCLCVYIVLTKPQSHSHVQGPQF